MTIIPVITAFLTCLLSILALRPLARKLGLMDAPGGRKTHTKVTPLIGGIGVFLGVLAGTVLSPEVFNHYQLLLACAVILLITGLVDDYYPLPAIVRMGIQIFAAFLMASHGDNQLVTLGRLVGDWEMFLGRFTLIMTIFATVGVINAVNMIDGLDGLSGGMVFICLTFLALASGISGNNAPLTTFSILLAACTLAFLLLNFRIFQKKPALIYLGDSGSMMLGFILAWVLIESSQGGADRVIPATVALWFLAIPLMDTVYLFIARPLSGKSPFEPGTDHLHHLLIQHGMSRTKVVLYLYAAAVLFGLIGLVITAKPALEPYSLYFFLFLFALYALLMRREKQF